MTEKPNSIWKRKLWPDSWLLKPLDWLLGLPWRLIRGLFSWRMLKRYFFCLACLATLIALSYAEENWRGRHNWNKFKREWEAKGESFDWHDFIPPPVPDDQNFAMTPFWEDSRYEWERHKQGGSNSMDTNTMNRLEHLRFNAYRTGPGAPQLPPYQGSWMDASNIDLKGWQAYYRAPLTKIGGNAPRSQTSQPDFPVPPQPGDPATDILMALGGQNDLLQMLRTASQRPYSRFPVDYEDGAGAILPPLAKLKGTAQYLDVLIAAELAAGKTEQAAKDLHMLFYVADSVKTEPFLISQLVRIAIFSISLNPLWEGMCDHKWSDAQLQSFQEKLESEDLLASGERSMKSEAAFIGPKLDSFASARLTYFQSLFGAEPSRKTALLLRFSPRGWFEQAMVGDTQPWLQGAQCIDATNQRVDLSRLMALVPGMRAAYNRSPLLNALYFSDGVDDNQDFSPPAISYIKKLIRGQTYLNLAITACALERYWLENKSYPEKLDKLVPKFLGKAPHEITSGEPLKYRLTDDGRFILYSTGIEGNDSGGHYRTGKDRKFTGNWVWRYPAK